MTHQSRDRGVTGASPDVCLGPPCWQPSRRAVRSQEVTTGNFLFDQLIDARRASLQSRAEDTDVAGHRCREKFPDGLRSVHGT